MKTALWLLFLSLTCLLSACQKDKPDFTGYQQTGGSTPNNGSTLTLGDSYQPVTKGTYYKYVITTPGSANDTASLTITGATTTFNSKTYYATTYNLPNGQSYIDYQDFLCPSSTIYSERDITATDTTELLYLKTDAAVGQTWSAELFKANDTTGIQSKDVGTMIAKNMTKTVLGKTYSNVIHTQLDAQVQALSGGPFTSLSTSDYYVAKGIGVIEFDITIFGITVKQQLLDYTIK